MLKSKMKEMPRTIVFYLILFVYCTWFLLTVNKGLDLTDSAYIMTLYKYIFDSGTQTTIGIALTNIFGGILWNLLQGGQALILSIISALLYTIDGLLIYKIFKKYVQPAVLLLMMLGASFYSISIFRILHYNAWSMFFLTLEIYLLYRWFEKLDKKYIFFCGILYGINIWIRIPNCVHGICLFAIIWYIANHEKKHELWKQIILMISGAVISFIIVSGIVIIAIGADEVWNGISQLFTLSMDSANVNNGHSFSKMLITIGTYLKMGLVMCFHYLWIPVLLYLAEYLGLKIYQKILRKRISSRFILAVNIIFGILYGIYIYKFQYSNEALLSFLVVLAIILSVIGAIVYRKKDLVLSAVCVMACLLELIIVFGTDNTVIWNIFFLFFPLGMITCLCNHMLQPRLYGSGMLLLAFVGTLVLTGGFNYASTHIYRDDVMENLNDTVDSKVYRGIKTTEERALFVSNLEEQLNRLPEGELLNMGNCTIGSLISDLPPAIKAWPDVESYSYKQFCTDLDSKVEQGILPYIVITASEHEQTEQEKLKYQKVSQLLEEYQYIPIYSDDDFVLYSSEK